MRIYSGNPQLIERAVRTINLGNETPCFATSGAVECLNRGYRVNGGCYIRVNEGRRLPIVAWAVALSNGEFHIYVLPKYRRKKIASRLIEFGRVNFPEHQFCPWNEQTLDMFHQKGVNYTREHLYGSLYNKYVTAAN